jgi:hypothetical protein
VGSNSFYGRIFKCGVLVTTVDKVQEVA